MKKELPAIEKTYEIIQWIYPRVAKFPRAYRYSLGKRIEDHITDILDFVAPRTAVPTKSIPAGIRRCITAGACPLQSRPFLPGRFRRGPGRIRSAPGVAGRRLLRRSSPGKFFACTNFDALVIKS